MIPDTKPLPEPIQSDTNQFLQRKTLVTFGSNCNDWQSMKYFENVSKQVFLSLLMIWNVFWWLKYITQNGQWDFMALWELKNSFHKSKIIFFLFSIICHQSGTKLNTASQNFGHKLWWPFVHGLPKLVAGISSQFQHLISSTVLTANSLVKWIPITVKSLI